MAKPRNGTDPPGLPRGRSKARAAEPQTVASVTDLADYRRRRDGSSFAATCAQLGEEIIAARFVRMLHEEFGWWGCHEMQTWTHAERSCGRWSP